MKVIGELDIMWKFTSLYTRECVRNLDLRVQDHPGELWVSKQRVHIVLKYGSEEKGSSLCRCSMLLGFIMSKKQERLRSELLSEDKITNLLGFLT